MIKYFAVSDIHSFFGATVRALNKKGFDFSNPDHKLILCGDAFDRGNSTPEVFELLKRLADQNRLIYIRGNHEDLLDNCVYEITRSRMGSHHISNGTARTIADFMNVSEYDVINRTFDWNDFDKAMNELRGFIKNNSVDYFELGDTIFVHGWVPITEDEHGQTIVHENFRDGDWKEARWLNGMEMFNIGAVPPGEHKTVVCGHWHTSWGWSNIKHTGDEWGLGAIFDPFVQVHESTGSTIIALDACTAYTDTVNCVVFDETGKLI